MKLMTIIVQDKYSDRLSEALVSADFNMTRMASTGGFLRQGNVTLLVGIEDDQIDTAMSLIEACRAAEEPDSYAATVFVLHMPAYLKL